MSFSTRNVAMLARLGKKKQPQNFCPINNCLYRTCAGDQHGNYTLCPKHIAARFPQCTCTNNGDYCDRCNATRAEITRAIDDGLDVYEVFG